MTTSTKHHWIKPASAELRILNAEILVQFLNSYQLPDVKKTHLFDGRYENIYLTQAHIPALNSLLSEAIDHAQDILETGELRAGFWFNYMPPGSTTTLHSHDDDDELLSCVYYVHVPENSGNIILYPKGKEALTQQSETGKFIFFKPDIKHEVSRNNSSQHRLSIGMNFGPVNGCD